MNRRGREPATTAGRPPAVYHIGNDEPHGIIMTSDEVKSRLAERLAELHGELEKTPELDAELEALLREVDADIHSLLEREQPGEAEVQSLRERLEALATDFDAQHPNTNIFFRELIHALGRMGI